jgi:hypothetical protein
VRMKYQAFTTGFRQVLDFSLCHGIIILFVSIFERDYDGIVD